MRRKAPSPLKRGVNLAIDYTVMYEAAWQKRWREDAARLRKMLFLGEQSVKNIAKPVGAYRVVLEPRVTKKKGAGRRMTVMRLAAALVVVASVVLWQFFCGPPHHRLRQL
jgi:type II secretory pathway component PulM